MTTLEQAEAILKAAEEIVAANIGWNGKPATATSIASALIEKHKALEEAEESRAVDLELLAQFMIQHSFATGHGDSIGALLAELDWQLRERLAR